MRGQSSHTASRSAEATYWAVMALSLISVLVLGWAFVAAGSMGLTFQQTTISNYFFAVLAGGVGFMFGGVAVTVNGQVSQGVKLSIRAIGGSALFLIALYHPFFAMSDGEQVKANKFESVIPVEITSPSTNSVVGRTVEVRGRTTHPTWRHFVIVTGPEQGSDVIQDGEVDVSPSGEMLGRATLGSVVVGAGELYTIRVVACEKGLKSGPFIHRNDLVFSNTITVTRSYTTEGS